LILRSRVAETDDQKTTPLFRCARRAWFGLSGQ
jgi:hypothetical protein